MKLSDGAALETSVRSITDIVPKPVVSPVYTPSAALCSMLVYQLNAAELAGNPILANAIAGTLMDMGCGGAAI